MNEQFQEDIINTLGQNNIQNMQDIQNNGQPQTQNMNMNMNVNNNNLQQIAIFEKLKMKLMEKDKIIFNQSQKEQELNLIIEKLNSELLIQNKNNENLKNKIQRIEKNLKQNESSLNKKNEELIQVSNENIQKFNDLKNENNNLIKKVNELNNILLTKEKDIQTNYINNEKNNNMIKTLREDIENKETELIKSNNIKNDLNSQNKQIPLLKKKIDELEKINNMYKEENIQLKEEQEKMIYEKEELENKLSQKIKECSKDKIHENNIINLNFKFENLYKEFQNILSENKTLTEKCRSMRSDNDTFTQIFTTELKNFLNFLESQNISTKIGLKMPISSLPSYLGANLGKGYELKYEIMIKCISQLKEKILEMLNSILNKVNVINEENTNLDEKNKNLINEQDNLKKDNQILKDKLNMTYQELYSTKSNYDSLNNEHQNLKINYNNIKTNLDNITKQNEKLSNEYNNLISSIQDKLFQTKVTSSNINLNLNLPKKGNTARNSNNSKKKTKSENSYIDFNINNDLINKISSLINLNNEMSKKLSETNNQNIEYKAKFNKLMNENNDLKNKLTYNDQSMTEQITELQNSKENELSKQKKILYDKIKSLTNLLEESNRLIKAYEVEVTQLKNKNSKLEYNLKMLTDSHSQLEKIVNNNTSGLKTELEMKEQNNNELLKEIEIKDLHIKSLEKLLGAQNPLDNSSLNINLYNNKRNKSEDFNVTFSNKFKPGISESSFEKDDEREKELNKLVNNFKMGSDDMNQQKIQPEAVFSNNFEFKYDKEMNDELRNLAKQTKEMDNVYNNNNIILNQSLRNQILNNKSMSTNFSNQTGKSNGNKIAGKIYVSKK